MFDIRFTPEAAQEIARLRQYQHASADAALRLRIEAGLCGDFSYAMAFDETDASSRHTEDVVSVTCGDIHVVAGCSDVPLLSGLTVDYSEDLMGGAFRYLNPNATYTCDCGTSFSIRTPDAEAD